MGPRNISFPLQLDFSDPRLRVTVYSHALTMGGPLRCWSYVTSGFEAWDRREMVLTVKMEAGETPDDYPQEPIGILTGVVPVVKADARVAAGSYLYCAAGPGLFGAHILFVAAERLDGVDLAVGTLAGIAITEDELNTVREFGASRLMARLGREAQYYPCPVWSDRARLRRQRPKEERTILEHVGRIQLLGVSAVYDRHTLTISATAAARVSLTELPDWSGDVTLAILTGIDPSANACLVWEPGLQGGNAIAPTGSSGTRMTGCFLLIAAGPQMDRNAFVIVEDGFFLKLTSPSAVSLRDALTRGLRLELPTDGPTIVVEAVDSAESVDADTGPTAGASIFIFHPDEVLTARGMNAVVFSRYIKGVMRVMDDALLAGELAPEFAVFVAVRPGRESRAWGAPPGLRARLEAIEPPSVNEGPIAFAVQSNPDAPLQTPLEWQTAADQLAAGQATSVNVDDMIARAW